MRGSVPRQGLFLDPLFLFLSILIEHLSNHNYVNQLNCLMRLNLKYSTVKFKIGLSYFFYNICHWETYFVMNVFVTNYVQKCKFSFLEVNRWITLDVTFSPIRFPYRHCKVVRHWFCNEIWSFSSSLWKEQNVHKRHWLWQVLEKRY